MQVNEGEIVRISDVGTTSAAIALTQAGWNTLRVRFGGEDGLPSEWAETRVFAYEIAFDTRGGTEADNLYVAYGDALQLPDPASDAYDFEGWYNIPNGSENNGALYEDAVFEERSDLILYAAWRGKTFEVTFDAQGGSVQAPTANVQYDAPFVLAVPEEEDKVAGRVFIGWFSGEDGTGTRYTDEKGVSLTDWNVAENTTLYAYWAEVLLYVETIGSGGEEGYSVQAGPGIGYVTSVTVPATYAGKPVTDIFSGAFRGCEELEEINLPNSLQTVGSVSSGESTGAFAGCTALRAINVYEVEGSHEVRYFSEDGVLLENSPQTGNVTIAYLPMARTGDYVVPDGVQELSAYTFTRAAISSVTIPDSVLFVRQRAFYYCLDLAEVNFAAGGTDGLLLEQYAFQGSVSLEEITLPARMTSVELASALFDGCDALENIYVEAGSANYVSVDGLLCDETGATLLYYPSGRTGAFTVPVTITAIGDGAFRDCAYLERVTFGENSNVTSIGGYAFSGCRRLEAFTIPETVTEIGTYAFENCATLEEITLTGQSVTVGNYAFSGCESLDSVSIGASVESFNFIPVFNDCAAITTVNVDPNNAFFATYDDVLYNKDLTTLIFCPRGRTEVSIADSTLVIGDNAFESCQITDVTLPDGVTTIGASAFYFSQLEQINIPASVATISDRAFYFCQHLQKVDFEERHDQPLKLGTYLFNSCSELESLVLPEGLLTIGSSAFSNCKSLTELQLPASVVTVSAGAFTGCAALSLTVDQANTHLTVQNGVLYENRSSALVFFGSATEVEIPEGVTTLASSLFANSAVTKVILPSSVTTLPASLFDGCTALKEVVINGRITSIGNYAFRNTAITSFTIGNSVTSVGSYAFSGCAALTSLVFEAGGTSVLTIGTYAFQNCTALTDLNLTLRVRDSGRVYGLGVGCFQGCTALENISFGVMYGMGFDTGAMLTLGSNSFRYCESLSSILIPDYVSSIASYVFQGCTALSEVILSDPLYETEDYFSSARGVFADCTSLESLTIPVNIIGWSDFGLFEGSCSVTSIQVAAENEAFCSIDGNLYSKDGTVLVQYAPGKTETSFVVPDGVTEIFGGAFVGCGSLMNVTVPASVQTISWFAFNGWTKDRTITVFFYDRRTACGKQGDIGNHAEPHVKPRADPEPTPC